MKNFKTPILYGFLIALAGILLMLSLIGLGLLGPKAVPTDKEMIGGTILFLMIYVFLLLGIYFGMKKRKEENNLQLSFKEALLDGFIISLSTAFFSVIFTYLFYEILYPDYVNELLTAMKLKMETLGISEEQIAEKLEEKKNYFSTLSQSGFAFIGNFITGMTFTFLLSFFLKSNKK